MSSSAAVSPSPPPLRRPLLILKPINSYQESALVPHFDLLKPWESSLPLPQFAAGVRALFVTGLVSIDAKTLDSIPSLGVIVTTSAGVDHIDLAECARRGVLVANAGTVFSDEVADYAVGLLISVLRRLPPADRYVRGGLWPGNGDYPLGSKVSGKRVGIVGLGSIGSKTAKRLEAFGCIISYTSRTKKPLIPYTYYSDAVELSAENDVLILTCALNSETHHIINKDVMKALGKDGVIINVGRGSLIDEKELVKQLVLGGIGGAGLDVFKNEPDVPEELVSMDNVVLSSHEAVLTSETYSTMLQLMIDNLDAFFSNRPLLTPV